MKFTQTLVDEVRRKCYITDTNQNTTDRLERIVKNGLTKVKRLIGVDDAFDFEAEGNEEELDLLLNYCWYDWNDASNEFTTNYLSDINSLHHKHEVKQYDSEEAQ